MTVILVIEDEAAIRDNLLRILRFKGFQVASAENGQQGVEVAQQSLPDLIICDIMMPILDGYGVLAALRQDPETAGIPFIFLTALTERDDMRQGMNSGADDYITKPFTSSELLDAVTARLAKQTTVTQPYRDEMQRATANLNRMAYADPLTNLPNRILFTQTVQQAVVKAQRSQTQLAVLSLNVHQFRQVNANWGRTMGDGLLCAIAQRLQDWLQPHAGTLAARLDDDEFSLLLDLPPQTDAAPLLHHLWTVLTQPYSLHGEILTIQVSLGGALFPDHATQGDRLMVQADRARRWCRQQHGQGYALYPENLAAETAASRSRLAELPGALAASQFQPYYQPQVNTITGRLIGLEACLHWHHPTEGLLAAECFMPEAAEAGLMLPIGAWLLRRVCEDMQALQTVSVIPLRVSIKLSAPQFCQPDLRQQVAMVLAQTHFDPQQLVIELAEATLLEHGDSAIATLEALKALGMNLAVHDFGTGYSSLNYLRRLPLDILKIDRSFVHQLTANERDAAMIAAIVALTKSLKLKAIAEGVETPAQLAGLRQHGCHLMQGNLFSQPVLLTEIQTLLQNDHRFVAGTQTHYAL